MSMKKKGSTTWPVAGETLLAQRQMIEEQREREIMSDRANDAATKGEIANRQCVDKHSWALAV